MGQHRRDVNGVHRSGGLDELALERPRGQVADAAAASSATLRRHGEGRDSNAATIPAAFVTPSARVRSADDGRRHGVDAYR